MNEVQLARIKVEIARLQAEAEKLERQAVSDERMYDDAWLEYGSKLAGPPQSIIVNRNMAKESRRKVKLLEAVVNGQTQLSDLPGLEGRISQINQTINNLNKEKGEVYRKIAFLRYLSEIVS